MLTLAEMIAKLRRYLADVDEAEWSDEVLTDALEDALEAVVNDLLANDGFTPLAQYSAYASLTAETEAYALPADCARVLGVMLRLHDDDDRDVQVQRRAPPDAALRSGSEAQFGSARSGAVPFGWWDDVPFGYIRIWPYLLTVSEEKYRFWYVHRPTFPTAGGGTFNVPSGEGDATDAVPNGIDRLCVYLARGMLGFEELRDGRPIGAFGQLYSGKLREFCRGPGRGLTPAARSYVVRVRR